MGGRGSSSGVSDKGVKYGTEYRTILAIDNIKFVMKNDGSATAPLETMSAAENRIYVTINKQNQIKTITFYDPEGKRWGEIHFGHKHSGMEPHIHVTYDGKHTDENTFSADKYQKLIDRVFEYWRKANA